MFAAACEIGARLGEASDEETGRLAAFGSAIGVAFQLFDDILDLVGTPEQTGKARGGDLRDGTITLPVIFALADDPALGEDVAAVRAGADAAAVCDRIVAGSGIARTRERALTLVAEARAALDAGPVNGADRVALHEIAEAVVDRHA